MKLLHELFGDPLKQAGKGKQAGAESKREHKQGLMGFCESCLADTLPEDAGSTSTFNGMGTRLYSFSDECPECQSRVQHLFFCFLWIPLVPLGRFRVKYCAPQRYFSRRLRPRGLNEREKWTYFWLYTILAAALLLCIYVRLG